MLSGDMIYINAGYRRTIVSPYVFLDFGDKKKFKELKKQIINNTVNDYTENLDVKYWCNEFKNHNRAK